MTEKITFTPDEAAIVLARLEGRSSPTIPRAVLWDAMEKLGRIVRSALSSFPDSTKEGE